MADTARIEAIDSLRVQFETERARRQLALTAAQQLHRDGRSAEAEDAYRAVIRVMPECAAAWARLFDLFFESGRLTEALDAATRGLRADSTAAAPHHQFGRLQQAPSVADEARRIHATLAGDSAVSVIVADGDSALAHLQSGNRAMSRLDLAAAIRHYEQAVRLDPEHQPAIANLSAAFALAGDAPRAALWRGLASYRRGDFASAIPEFVAFLQAHAGDPSVYLALGECYRTVGLVEESLETYTAGQRHWPDIAMFYERAAGTLRSLGRVRDAIRMAAKGIAQCPGNLTLEHTRDLMLPAVYESEHDVRRFRSHYAAGLERLRRETRLDTGAARDHAVGTLQSVTNFYLPYQGGPDRSLQTTYGQWATRIMDARYPQWASATSRPIRRGGPLRIGYVSAYCRQHTVGNLFLGWLQRADHARFHIHCYHLGRRTDVVTEDFRSASEVFRHVPDFDVACDAIAGDDLDVLVYLDVGMFPMSTALAALRLARVQCAAWGHPVTTGLPSIDYFLSADLMEPDGDTDYSESLIRLPGIGISFDPPEQSEALPARRDLGLREDSVVFFCGQSPYKYLPRYDGLLVDIARAVPDAQFVFVATHPSARVLEHRIARVFSAAGLAGDACVFAPQRTWPAFLGLIRAADVCLDTLEWSGGHTSLEAIAMGRPIVTCPRGPMRGRHTAAFLTTLGVTDTIATCTDEYVSTAVALGTRADWRGDISRRMLDGHGRLFSDTSCVRALEAFYERSTALQVSA